MSRRTLEIPEDEAKTTNVLSAPVSRPGAKWLLGGLLCLGVLWALITFINSKWLFTRDKVIADLEEATSSKLEVRSFRPRRFPRPGCVLEGLIFRRPQAGPNAPPLLTVRKLVIRGSFFGLITKHVALVRAEDAHAVIPPFGTGGWAQSKSPQDAIVDELEANGSVLEFSRKSPRDPLVKFLIREFSIQGLGSKGKLPFKAVLRTPEPPGDARLAGSLGPWKDENPTQTPISGDYSFNDANLGAFSGIAGKLASDGKFGGTLNHMDVEGTTSIPEFEVKRSGHNVDLKTQYRAVVDAMNGDVSVEAASSHFWRTKVQTSGTIAGEKGKKGKTASLQMWSREARIQDVLMLFISEPKAPLNGALNFKIHTQLPPGDSPFLRKVQLEGDFGIDSAKFTNSDTQHTVDDLSEHARGGKDDDNPERVLSDLKGHVVLKNGIATFTQMSFNVPGAIARMHGTYDLVSERINLQGDLQIQAKPSDATSGMKSFLLKAFDPFLKNNHHNALVPVKITGTYSKPNYAVSSKPK
jgi:hypothetical protein